MEKDFGFVQDVCADLESGTITSIIVPGSNKILSMFSANNDIVIDWQQIKCIRRWCNISWSKLLIYIINIVHKQILKGICYIIKYVILNKELGKNKA